MKILIVDDNESKADTIARVLEAIGVANLSIVCAGYLSEAAQRLADDNFDLIILDLMVPFIKDGVEQSGAGLELLRLARKQNGRNAAARVLGLTAFPDEIPSAREKFEENGASIIEFDEEGRWRRKVERAVLDLVRWSENLPRTDLLIVTALDEERAAYNHLAASPGTHSATVGLNIERLEFGKLSAAILRTRQMGLVAATLDTSLAISILQPRIVAMSGICAGLREKTVLGQLIVASPAWEYQAGKWSTNGFEIAPDQIKLPPKTRVLIEQAINNDEFVAGLERRMGNVSRPSTRSRAIVSPAASGSAVIADSARLAHIQTQHRKVSAVDMEVYGVYAACAEAPWPPDHFFAIKCVVDFADGTKNDVLHEYGCWLSAAAAIDLSSKMLDTTSKLTCGQRPQGA